MKIAKVRFAKHTPGIIERHCVAFMTQSGEVVLVDSIFNKRDRVCFPIFNTSDAVRIASDVMRRKASSLRFAPTALRIAGLVAWERTEYNPNLVEMARTGQLTNVIVIENVPESIEELQRFAGNALRETLSWTCVSAFLSPVDPTPSHQLLEAGGQVRAPKVGHVSREVSFNSTGPTAESVTGRCMNVRGTEEGICQMRAFTH